MQAFSVWSKKKSLEIGMDLGIDYLPRLFFFYLKIFDAVAELQTTFHPCFHATPQTATPKISARVQVFGPVLPASTEQRPAASWDSNPFPGEYLCVTGKHNRSSQSQPNTRQANTPRGRYPEYTRTNIDNARWGTIWHESELRRSDMRATMCISSRTASGRNIPGRRPTNPPPPPQFTAINHDR